jgi:uncharacterized membrane protein YjjB (DUF3815 family)
MQSKRCREWQWLMLDVLADLFIQVSEVVEIIFIFHFEVWFDVVFAALIRSLIWSAEITVNAVVFNFLWVRPLARSLKGHFS